MTFFDKIFSPSQYLVDPYQKMFMTWGMKKHNIGRLFSYANGKEDIMMKVYVMIKRLGFTDIRVLTMPSEDRDYLFKIEMDLIEHEKKKDEPNNL